MIAAVARPKGRETRGCYLEQTSTGRIRLCFRWQRPRPYRITTDLRMDDPRELEQAERARDLVGAEIRAGSFDPLRRFPSYFSPKVLLERPTPDRGSFADEIEAWIDECERPNVRRGRIRNYRNDLKNYIRKHPIGSRPVNSVGEPEYRQFQRWLVTSAGENGKGVSEKTAANVIRSTIRAFLRDTKRSLTPLEALRWERYRPKRRQDVFEPSECGAILRWFKTNRPFDEYVSIELRLQGVTPSEARGLEVGDYSRRTKSLEIQRSQYGGDIGATKTVARERVVLLDDKGAAAVAKLCGIRKPGEFLLRVNENALVDQWRRCLTALGFNYRSIYQCKHSYAVNSLEAGENPSDVARNLGISLATLDKYYAASIRRRTGRRLKTPRVQSGNPSKGNKA